MKEVIFDDVALNVAIPIFESQAYVDHDLDDVLAIVVDDVPPLLFVSAASSAFGGYAVPKFAQLCVTSYYAASSTSHHAISYVTRYIEEAHTSRVPCISERPVFCQRFETPFGGSFVTAAPVTAAPKNIVGDAVPVLCSSN
ncbi:hypothetical protein Sjap_002107 [Stephania japonica]|uniref:Uncharacterized protein n=1 Tax=Stephania japonica TaxID=461633 RepID=A0AAP0PSB9_9MAGN